MEHQYRMTTSTCNTTSIEEYISLPLGKTFIRWHNVTQHPENSVQSSSSRPVLFMLHGFGVPSWHFDALIPELICRNSMQHYRVLSIDLYGHGRSARPNTKYNLDLFVTQVLDVIDQCCVGCKHIVGLGYSMGSAVMAHVVSSKQQVFRGLILVAPMLHYKSVDPKSRIFYLPVVGKALVQKSVVPKMKKRFGERFINEIESRGSKEISFADVILRIYRHGVVCDQAAVYKKLADTLYIEDEATGSLKIHVMWGSEDNVVNEQQVLHILRQLGKDDGNDIFGYQLERANLVTKGITFNKLEGLKHQLLLSHPKICADDIANFLNNNDEEVEDDYAFDEFMLYLYDSGKNEVSGGGI